MIWKATEADIPALVEMGRSFHAASPHRVMGAYKPEAATNVLRWLIGSEDGLVLTNGAGAIGGIATPTFFSPDVRLMDECFWWSRGGAFALLRAFEREATNMRATVLYLSALENERTPAMARALARAGYTPIEHRFMKEVG